MVACRERSCSFSGSLCIYLCLGAAGQTVISLTLWPIGILFLRLLVSFELLCTQMLCNLTPDWGRLLLSVSVSLVLLILLHVTGVLLYFLLLRLDYFLCIEFSRLLWLKRVWGLPSFFKGWVTFHCICRPRFLVCSSINGNLIGFTAGRALWIMPVHYGTLGWISNSLGALAEFFWDAPREWTYGSNSNVWFNFMTNLHMLRYCCCIFAFSFMVLAFQFLLMHWYCIYTGWLLLILGFPAVAPS